MRMKRAAAILASGVVGFSSGVGGCSAPRYSVRLENQNDFVARDYEVAFDEFRGFRGGDLTRGGSSTSGLTTSRIPQVARVRWTPEGEAPRCAAIRVKDIVPDEFGGENATMVFALLDKNRATVAFEVPAAYGEYQGMRVVHSTKLLAPRAAVTNTACR